MRLALHGTVGHERRASDVLLLAAFGPELEPLRSIADGNGAIACREVGVGLAAAAVGAVRALVEHRPKAAVLVGTCGAYAASGIAVEAAVVARGIVLVEPCSLSALGGLSELPSPPMVVSMTADATLLAALEQAGALASDVATTLGVTVDDRTAAAIAEETRTSAEHMEAFAVARACADLGVPFAAVLGVANIVGRDARRQWKANHRRASASAARVVREWLDRGAPGVGSKEEG